ncbi:MAG: hypothetical protein RQ885_11575 [Desulfurococcales archaeon]|nr:hypothetical protein [Desulfurococcales archaeon]
MVRCIKHYRELRERFGLLSRTAIDCYRMPLLMLMPGGIILEKGKKPRVRKRS